MPKNQQQNTEDVEVKPKWMKPANFQKPEQPEPKQPKWQNPNDMTYRQRMDRRLERAGLLNYQTKGLSAEEIAQRYAGANIKISSNSSWFKDNYGFDAPETITNREAMQKWRQAAEQGQATSIFPTLQIDTKKPVVASGGNADRPQNYLQTTNGLLVKAPKMQPQAVTDSPVAGQVLATNEQALKGEVNWADVSSTEREKMLKDPTFYSSGQITKYPAWMQQQIMADKNFDWKQLPAWQKVYYDLSSSPTGMGAVQGGLMGLGSGNPIVGTGVGALLGWRAAASGYDQTKEFWQQKGVEAGAFGLFNFLAEQAEKGIGMGFQIANAAVDPKKNVVDVLNKESWNAGAGFFEVITPAWIDAVNQGKGELGWDDLAKAVPTVYMLGKIGDVIAHPEKYKGNEIYLGAEAPMQLDKSWVERIDEARAQIKAGKPYREVMMEMQTGVMAQMGDMVGQAVADPLNVLPEYGNKVAGKIAEMEGNKVAAEAFRSTEGTVEAGRKYRTLVQSGQATIIDPNFKLNEMSDFARFIAGVNDQGQVKAGSLIGTQRGLLDPMTGKNKAGWLEDMVTQTPYSRAQTGAGMFYENVSAMMQMFDTPEQAAKYIKALSNSDMTTWSELGTRFAESPEFYTVLPALQDFKGSLDGIVQTWEMSAPNRDLLARVADIMGDQPGNVLEDLASHGTAEQDFQRLVKRLQEASTPEAKALLADVDAGRFTAETLKQMIDVFTGDDALPWHPGQWKAMMLDQMGDHFDQWVTQRLMLDKSPEAQSAFFRTSALMKQAQSILLLGGSPGYAITNGLSNMVHRAVSGVFGYMTGKQIDGFMERFGLTPARFEEGVGIGGQVEQAAGSSKVKTSEMDKAVKGKGPLTTAKDALAKISGGMPFSKLSRFFEKNEGRQAFAIAMKDAWSQSWRRGVGFREMSPDLVRVLNEMGVDPKRVYGAIEAGMNQTEIENLLKGRQQEVQARSLIHDAAEKTGVSASEAAQMLERIGILDTLDKFLAGQMTPDGVDQAFARAERVAQDWMDMRTGEELKAKAENVKQRVGLEGAAAALDVAQKAHGEFTDAWMDHYYRFGEVMQNLMELDEGQRDKALDYAYDLSDKEFRRVDATNAANWQGVFDAWGLSGDPRALRVLDSMGEVGSAMGGAYRQMRENFKAWREKWAYDPTNPARWDELTAIRAQNDALFKQAFKQKHDAEVKMGAALAEIYEAQHGPAAGEAARKWWEDVVAFNDEIVKRERNFRGEMAQAQRAGVPKELIEAQKQKYYSETKIQLIAELERINSEGVARLERVIKNGGGQTPVSGVPVEPVGPVDGVGGSAPVASEPNTHETVSRWVESQYAKPAERKPVTPDRVDPVEEVNALMAAAEQRKGREKVDADARKAAVWDVAEEYWGKGGNYNRGILQDGFALVNALRKPEYGGIPDLTWLDDPRLTPEIARNILETRKAAKETSAAAAAEQAFTVTEKARGKKFDTSQINEDTSILRAVALHGGLSLELAKDITGETKPKGVPGLFTRKGLGIDEIARMLADDGYPIRIDDPNDIGGMQQARDLINRARAGDKVYPMGHSFDAEINAAEQAWIESFNFDGVQEVPFDSSLWQSEFDAAVQAADLGRVYEMIGNFPDEMLAVDSGQTGVTWKDYLSRVADEVAVRSDENARMESVAERAANVQETMAAAESHAEAVTKRTVLMESLADAFKLDEQKVAAYGEVSDALADWYARMTGETRDDFYNKYFGDVKKESETRTTDGLLQEAEKNLVAVHNLSAANLIHADGLGGIAMPSLAILRKDLQFDGFGEITLIARDRLIDPGDRTNVVGNADLYTPRYPSAQVVPSKKMMPYLEEAKNLLNSKYGKEVGDLYRYNPYSVLDEFKNRGVTELENNPMIMAKFLEETGKPLPEKLDGITKLVREQYGEEFTNYVERIAEKFTDKRRFFKGFTDSGNRRYADYTLDNIVKDMKANMKEGETFNYGSGTVRSKAAKKFSSIEAIRKNEGKLISAPEMEKIKTDFNDRLVKLAENNQGNYTRDVGFGYLDTFAAALTEGIQNKNIERTFREYQFNTENMNFDEIRQYVQDLRDAPSEYFEAKVKRAVGLDEFSAAVVPAGTSQRVKDVLAKYGIETMEYDPNAQGGRRDVVARTAAEKNLLFQNDQSQSGRVPGTIDKGMVTFEDMKATITAFEAADFSTVIHESGHIYRRVLADVAERTGNPYILRDLNTIEEWAGVKDGKWTRDAEEKFARGFERYVTEGNAPTPKLRAAFESFKKWMLDIYKSIAGSSIDVKLTDDVKRVFDRMLGAENTRIDLDSMLRQMNYDPKYWFTDPMGNIVKRPEFKIEINQEKAARDVAAMDLEGMQARAQALRERMAGGGVQPGPDAESIKNYREGWRSWASMEEPPVPQSKVRELTDWTLEKMNQKSVSSDQKPVTSLFQSEVPFGMYDEKAQFRPASDGMDATWRERVMPLLSAMKDGAKEQMSVGDGAFRDMSPEGRAMLNKYMQQVKGEMATTKLATVRFAEKQRDFALLNYSKRYGYDRMGDFLATYQLYPTRSMVNWMARAVDKPALFSNYARLRQQQERYKKDMPERLRGKIRIPAPWLPEWAGDSLYIDPLRNLFFPDTVARYFERAQQDKNYQMVEAERVLQEWQADGQYSDAEILEAAKTQKGKVWERAFEEAQMRRESETSNPVDFFTSFFGPSWFLTTPLNMAGVRVPGISKGDPNKVSTLPLGNTARALDTVTDGTWAEPVGDLIGLIGKGEDALRKKFNLPTRGEYGEYYTKKQVAMLVTEGRVSPEDAQRAMIEKTGPIWEEAQKRVDMEMAMRVPLAGVTYAALHGGPKAAAQAALPSLFGSSLLPAGELEYRGLKDEWNEAWKLADAGDTKAVQRFFDNHPEYEAWLAKNKDDGELLKSFLIGQVWDAYMGLGDTNQKQARAELGDAFRQSFLDKETRSYETLDVNQLAEWARLLGAKVPTPSVAGATNPPTSTKLGEADPKLQLYPEQVTGITDQFFEQRRSRFPNYYEEQAGYYALPKSERKSYLAEHPDLKAYWSWKDGWYKSYPQYVPIFNGDAFDRVDTSGWMPGLEDAVREAAMSGGRLGQGARAALMNEWLLAGQPMGDFDTWVKGVVMPGMMYGNGE